MFCRVCGNKIEDGMMFCTNCGTRVRTEVPASAPVAQQPAVQPAEVPAQVQQVAPAVPTPVQEVAPAAPTPVQEVTPVAPAPVQQGAPAAQNEETASPVQTIADVPPMAEAPAPVQQAEEAAPAQEEAVPAEPAEENVQYAEVPAQPVEQPVPVQAEKPAKSGGSSGRNIAIVACAAVIAAAGLGFGGYSAITHSGNGAGIPAAGESVTGEATNGTAENSPAGGTQEEVPGEGEEKPVDPWEINSSPEVMESQNTAGEAGSSNGAIKQFAGYNRKYDGGTAVWEKTDDSMIHTYTSYDENGKVYYSSRNVYKPKNGSFDDMYLAEVTYDDKGEKTVEKYGYDSFRNTIYTIVDESDTSLQNQLRHNQAYLLDDNGRVIMIVEGEITEEGSDRSFGNITMTTIDYYPDGNIKKWYSDGGVCLVSVGSTINDLVSDRTDLKELTSNVSGSKYYTSDGVAYIECKNESGETCIIASGNTEGMFPTVYEYDENGNLLTSFWDRYTYNNDGNLIHKHESGAGVNDDYYYTYENGRLVKEEFNDQIFINNSVTYYSYDESGDLRYISRADDRLSNVSVTAINGMKQDRYTFKFNNFSDSDGIYLSGLEYYSGYQDNSKLTDKAPIGCYGGMAFVENLEPNWSIAATNKKYSIGQSGYHSSSGDYYKKFKQLIDNDCSVEAVPGEGDAILSLRAVDENGTVKGEFSYKIIVFGDTTVLLTSYNGEEVDRQVIYGDQDSDSYTTEFEYGADGLPVSGTVYRNSEVYSEYSDIRFE